jgi:uncharacterized membrane protein YgcG
MIAYNLQWLHALRVQELAAQWHKKNLLTDAQHQLVEQHYPVGFYSPNVFIRIGLGFFCCVLLGAFQSFVWVLVGISSEWSSVVSVMGGFNLFLGAGCLLALEFVIKNRHHYASGIDDILLYSGMGQCIAGLLLFISDRDDPLPFFCIAFPFLATGAVRYLDRLLTILAYGCLFTIIMLVVNKIPSMALYLLPLTGILFSIAVYMLVKKNQAKTAWQPWAGNLQVLEVLSLITLYLSGNYLMIQEGADELFGMPQVPLAWFFWGFTFLMPLGFIYVGLRNKDRILLWMGLGCVSFAVFTFRTYFHVMPLPTASTLAGAFLFAIAYFSIQYLKKGKVTFTYAPDEAHKPFFAEAEALAVAQTFGHTTQTPQNDLSFGGGQFGGGQFGGGQFGGGGAGGDY